MKKLLYHGSEKIIRKPTFGYGKLMNDYGRCFYTTESIDMAMEWSVDKNRNGYVNSYSIDCEGLNILDLTDEKYCILNWLAILVANRRFDLQTDFSNEVYKYLMEYYLPDLSDVDVIIGYRADDSYFSFAQDFLNNVISIRLLARAMSLGKLGVQVAIKSEKAFDRLVFQEYEEISAALWFPKKTNRDELARSQYKEMKNEGWKRGETYIMQVIDEEIKSDDIRLRPDITL